MLSMNIVLLTGRTLRSLWELHTNPCGCIWLVAATACQSDEKPRSHWRWCSFSILSIGGEAKESSARSNLILELEVE
uniref:Uncharacterized protein n=1 Tax=Triticum urartu TaxID=4572 RepID=A0A8R7VDM9_TRIUA